MKKDKIIYWATTIIVSGMMLFSAYMYLTSPDLEANFRQIGFPDYFRVELAVAKLLGALALLVPMVPYGFKFAAYVGFAIVFVSAAITHVAINDTAGALMPLVFLGILGVSFWSYRKLSYPVMAIA